MNKFLILLLLFTTTVQAEYVVKYIPKGTVTDFDGFLITPDTEKQFRLTDQELIFADSLILSYKTIIKSYDDNNTIMETRINNLQKQNETLIEQQSKLDGTFSKVAMFLLGAATTVLISYGVHQATK